MEGRLYSLFWIEEGKNWLGLWGCHEVKTPYHPSVRHIAFTVSYEDLKSSVKWLQSLDIDAMPFGKRQTVEPFVRPYQGNASVYFQDPDGNSLEFISFIDVPPEQKFVKKVLSLKEWEQLLR